MPALLEVRPLKTDEAAAIQRLSHSRTEPVRLVQRAQMIGWSSQGYRVAEIADIVGCSPNSVRLWIKRFTVQGLPGLQDSARSGRPTTYTPEQVSIVIETALTKPESLGLPFACWTLDRLQAYLNDEKRVG